MYPNQFRLTDGTIVRRCPTDKPLYCSRAGKFYSVHNRLRAGAGNLFSATDEGCVMREVQPSFSPARRKRWRSSNGISGTQYPVMRHFDCMNCHTLIALTWIGPRPEAVSDRDGKAIRYEIDHLNGDRCDYSADNLQYVTPAENHRRAKVLRELRAQGVEPREMTYTELRSKMSENETTDMGCRAN